MQRSTKSLLVFVTYFGVKSFLEKNEYDETMQFLVGTSNGIVFSVFLGFISAYALTVIYEMRRTAGLKHLAFGLVFLYLAYVLFLAFGTYHYHVAFLGADRFLIVDQEGHYQRTGDFLLMQVILIGSLFWLTLPTAGRFRFFSCLPIYILLIITTALFGLTAQVVGSNSGLVGPVSFLFVVTVMYIVLSFEDTNTSDRKLSSQIFSGIKIKLLIGAIVSVCLMVGSCILMLNISGVDVDTLRVTDFRNDENTSLLSRSEIFNQNFIPYFSYKPIFGHSRVEELAGGGVARMHSLLSILTHLGLAGFFVFLLML